MCAQARPRRRSARVLVVLVTGAVFLGLAAHQRARSLDWQTLDRAVQMHRQELRTREALTILEDVASRRDGTLLGGKALLAMIDLHDYLGEYDAARQLSKRAITRYAGTETGEYAKLRLEAMEQALAKWPVRKEDAAVRARGSTPPDSTR